MPLYPVGQALLSDSLQLSYCCAAAESATPLLSLSAMADSLGIVGPGDPSFLDRSHRVAPASFKPLYFHRPLPTCNSLRAVVGGINR